MRSLELFIQEVLLLPLLLLLLSLLYESTLTSFPIQLELPFSTPTSFFSSQWW